MKDILIVIGLSIGIIPYALICVVANLFISCKSSVRKIINEEIESIKYSQFFINR